MHFFIKLISRKKKTIPDERGHHERTQPYLVFGTHILIHIIEPSLSNRGKVFSYKNFHYKKKGLVKKSSATTLKHQKGYEQVRACCTEWNFEPLLNRILPQQASTFCTLKTTIQQLREVGKNLISSVKTSRECRMFMITITFFFCKY